MVAPLCAFRAAVNLTAALATTSASSTQNVSSAVSLDYCVRPAGAAPIPPPRILAAAVAVPEGPSTSPFGGSYVDDPHASLGLHTRK